MSLAHKDDYYETPPWVIEQIKNITGHDEFLDGCADYNNRKFEKYIPDDHYDGALNNEIPEHQWNFYKLPTFLNPPRSKNGKFVTKVTEMWKTGHEFVILLCWNDLGNKYCDEIRNQLLAGDRSDYGISAYNLGKIKFYKNGIESQYPSRLSYLWVWLM